MFKKNLVKSMSAILSAAMLFTSIPVYASDVEQETETQEIINNEDDEENEENNADDENDEEEGSDELSGKLEETEQESETESEAESESESETKVKTETETEVETETEETEIETETEVETETVETEIETETETEVESESKAETFKVTFMADGDEVDSIEVEDGYILEESDYPEAPEIEGKSFIDWSECSEITEDTIITAEYENESYVVTFLDVDGSEISKVDAEYGDKVEAPEMTDVLFLGWFDADKKPIDFETYEVTGDLTVTAKNRATKLKTLNGECDGINVYVKGNLPEGAELVIEDKDNSEYEYLFESDFEEDETMNQYFDKETVVTAALDITIMVDDEEYQPKDFGESVVVTLTNLDKVDIPTEVKHIDGETGEAEDLMTIPEKRDRIVFETDSFSVYTVGGTDYDTSSADATYSAGTDITAYWFADDGLLIFSGSGAMNDYSYNNIPWKSICSEIKKIYLSENITSIGEYAFCGCSALTSVSDLSNITSIGEHAFYNCNSLTSVNLLNVISIGDWAFSECKVLTSVGDLSNITSIGDNAFYECLSLISVNLSNKITEIPDCAFAYCNALTSVGDLSNVTSIGGSAFNSCRKLTSVNLSNKITEIPTYAFAYCNALTSVGDLSNVTSIGDWSFLECGSITSVGDLLNVTSIGNYAFKYCSSLQELSFSNNIEYIYQGTFENCSSLKKITGLQNVIQLIVKNENNSFQTGPFAYCSSLETIDLQNVEYIARGSFSNCISLTSVGDLSNVKTINYSAFQNCTKLTDFYLPNVTSIGNNAFYVYSPVKMTVTGNDVALAYDWASDNRYKDITEVFNLTYNGTVYEGMKPVVDNVSYITKYDVYTKFDNTTSNGYTSYYYPSTFTNLTLTCDNFVYGADNEVTVSFTFDNETKSFKTTDISCSEKVETNRKLNKIEVIYNGGNIIEGLLPSKDDITVTATYDVTFNNGTTGTVTKDIVANDYILSATTVAGTNTATITYGSKTDTFTYTGVAKEIVTQTLSALNVTLNIDKDKIHSDTIITKDNLIVLITNYEIYNNGTNAYVKYPVSIDDCTVSIPDKLVVGEDNIIEVTYTDPDDSTITSTAKLFITVIEKPTITTAPTNTSDDDNHKKKHHSDKDNNTTTVTETVVPALEIEIPVLPAIEQPVIETPIMKEIVQETIETIETVKPDNENVEIETETNTEKTEEKIMPGEIVTIPMIDAIQSEIKAPKMTAKINPLLVGLAVLSGIGIPFLFLFLFLKKKKEEEEEENEK